MQDEEIGFCERQEVTVSVHSGDVTGVELSTVVLIENFLSEPVKAQVKLQGIVNMLLKALPITEIAAMDRVPDTREPVVSKDGTVSVLPKKTISGLRAQAELQRMIEKNNTPQKELPQNDKPSE